MRHNISGAGGLPDTSPLKEWERKVSLERVNMEDEEERSQLGHMKSALLSRQAVLQHAIEGGECIRNQMKRENCSDCTAYKVGHRPEELVAEKRWIDKSLKIVQKHIDSYHHHRE
ncbi:MAG: hypothetical protein WD200_01915 [Candidatus Andersenbacteria bacterium]